MISAITATAQPPGVAPLPALPATAEPQSQAAPAAAVQSAQAAVAQLGEQVVQGRYQVAVERMNPLWKERMAARMGGIDAIEKQLAGVSEQMIQQGITIISFEPQGQPSSYEVSPGKKVENVGGQQVESLVYTKWLVLVPTLTKFRIFPKGSQKAVVIESTGFQAAISDKDKNDWTFIDGSSLNQSELRKLFVNLPQDIVLPPLGKREVR
jgi:hypothetical protein